jgi:lipid II:glycine glycyltransferase (peptidoglycan interpeptide bridge formation enzyme)
MEYYRGLFTHVKEYQGRCPTLHLYTAKHAGDTLAAIVVLVRGAEATYLYGASSDRDRNFMAPYTLQWQAMQDAKAAGCTRYDLFGIAPDDNPAHPLSGLYRFKTGFGGTIIHRPGCYDYAYHPVVTSLFAAAESFRKRLRHFRRHF